MTDGPFQRVRRFFAELKRRKVYRVAAVYAGVTFVTLQAARLIFPATTLEGVYDVLVVIAFVGFPIAVVLAWAFEVTPEGVRRTPKPEPTEEAKTTAGGSRTGYKILVGLGLVAAAVAGGWYLTGGGGGGEPTARLGDRSIAVLPFEALGREEPGTFTEGMHDDLLARLSNISDLRVISRTAVQQYRNSDKTTGEIARELGVRWVLEGAVQEMEDQIQVNAQLIDPRTETHAWAETYQRDLTAQDLFDLQGEITRRIARSLETELTPQETRQVDRQSTEDLEAYRLYVKGRDRLDTRTESGVQEAVAYFQRAIRQDSTYALAWAGLADARGLYGSYAEGTLGDSVPDHETAARRALQLDPTLAEAHASIGFFYLTRRNAPAARRELNRAVELKPSYAQAHHWLGYTETAIGRLVSAREHLELAVEINPNHLAAGVTLAGVYVAAGGYEKALAEARRIRRLYSESPGARMIEVLSLYHMGRFREAARIGRAALFGEASGAGGTLLATVAVSYAAAGDTARTRQWLAKSRRQIPDMNPYFEGVLHAALGETEAAFSDFERADWAPRPSMAMRFMFPDVLAQVRQDPRYEELTREVNRIWGLNPDGSLPDSVDVSFDSPSNE